MITHSEICGPWTPDAFEIGILVSLQMGVLIIASEPALKSWTSLRFLALSTSGGKVPRVSRTVVDSQISDLC